MARIILNKDFRKWIDSFFDNIAIASQSKMAVRRLLRVVDEWDGSGQAIADGGILLVDAVPQETPVLVAQATDRSE